MYQIVGSPPLAGSCNIWSEFFDPDQDVGGKVPCKRPKTFSLYLCSASTYGARVEKKLPRTGLVTLRVFGPICSDGERLYIEYGISSAHFQEPSQFAHEEIHAIRVALKKHIRVKDREWGRSGNANARETFRILGLAFPSGRS